MPALPGCAPGMLRIVFDLLHQVPGHVTFVLLLQIFPSPVLTGDHLAAARRPALTLHFVIVVVRRRPIVSQFFIGFDVSQRNKNNLSLHADVRLAGVIAKDHAPFSVLFVERTDEEIFRDLNLGRAKRLRELLKCFAVEDIPALYTNDLSPLDRLDREQTSSLNRAFFHRGFG